MAEARTVQIYGEIIEKAKLKKNKRLKLILSKRFGPDNHYYDALGRPIWIRLCSGLSVHPPSMKKMANTLHKFPEWENDSCWPGV